MPYSFLSIDTIPDYIRNQPRLADRIDAGSITPEATPSAMRRMAPAIS